MSSKLASGAFSRAMAAHKDAFPEPKCKEDHDEEEKGLRLSDLGGTLVIAFALACLGELLQIGPTYLKKAERAAKHEMSHCMHCSRPIEGSQPGMRAAALDGVGYSVR